MPVEINDSQSNRQNNSCTPPIIEPNSNIPRHEEQDLYSTSSSMQPKTSFINTQLGVTLNAAVSSVSSTSSAHSSGDSNSQNTGALLSSPNEMQSSEEKSVCTVTDSTDSSVKHSTHKSEMTYLVEQVMQIRSSSQKHSDMPSVTCGDTDSCGERIQSPRPDSNHNLHASMVVETEMSVKSSPTSNKTIGPELDSPDSAELPSMPSDKSDSHGNSDGRCPELGEEATSNSLIGESDVADTYLKSLHVKTDCSLSVTPVDSQLDSTSNIPQTETMASLENTIDSVLELIRTGRENEVEFNSAIRQQPQVPIPQAAVPARQMQPQSKSQPLSSSTAVSTAGTQNCSPSNQSVGGRRESPTYLANRQRIQSALDQATSTYFNGLPNNTGLGQHSDQAGSLTRPMFSKHMTGQPNAYPPLPHPRYSSHPNLNSNVIRMPHQQPMYMPSPYGRNMAVRSQYPVLHQHQQYRQHSPVYPGFSVQGNSQVTSVGSSYYSPPILSPGAPPVRQFMHPRLSHVTNQQQLSPGASTSPRVVNLPIGNHSSFRDQPGPLPNFPTSRHYSPNYSESSNAHHSSFPSGVHKKSGPVMQSSLQGVQNSAYATNPTPQQRFSQELYHATSNPLHHQLSTNANKSQLMPPPMTSATTPGKKRKMSMNRSSECKRKRTSKSYIMDSNCQQLYTTEQILEDTLKRLSMMDFPSLVQDPLVTTSISLIPPIGGQQLGNVVNGFEAEKAFSKLVRPSKYRLPPYTLKHPKPVNMNDLNVNGYLLQTLPNIKPPERLILSNSDMVSSSLRSATPDNPIPGTPEPQPISDNAMGEMLNNFPSSKQNNLNGRTTPPLPLMYPLVFTACLPSGLMLSNNPIPNAVNPSNEKLVNSDADKFRFTLTLNSSQDSGSLKSLNIDSAKTSSVISPVSSKNLISQMLLDHKMPSKKSGYSDLTKSHTASQCSRYSEESITMTSLIASKKQISCRHCEMLVDGSQCITRKLGELVADWDYSFDKDKLDQAITFCSVNCLTKFSKLIDVNACDFEENSDICSQTGRSQNSGSRDDYLQVPVLLQGRLSKLSKFGTPKRHHSMDRLTGKRKFNRFENGISTTSKPMLKRWRNVRWKKFSSNVTSVRFYKEIPETKMRHILAQYSPQLRIKNSVKDERVCLLCKAAGDASDEIAGRLLNYGVNVWLHLNCALWCFDAYETVSGALIDVVPSVERALRTLCGHCGRYGAGLTCYRSRCPAIYHLPCAYSAGCMFFTDRGMYCPSHRVKDHPLHLPRLIAERRVYISRDESEQVANVVLDEGKNAMSLRIGSVILHQVGQLLPEQVASGLFHSKNCIYPVGYRTSRYYWSSRHVNQRCKYQCSIEEFGGKPLFIVSVEESGFPSERHQDSTSSRAWGVLLQRIVDLRKSYGLIKLFPQCLPGDYLFGLTESHIVRAIESLPGVECLKNYAFKFGRMQLITEMPLAINPTGCVRSEPKLRTYVRRSHCPVRHATSSTREPHVKGASAGLGDHTHNLSRFVSGKTQQYRRLKYEWKFNVSLGRSRIQGLGLFAAREMEKFTFIIEYLGEMIRNEVANRREQLYESQNRGVYMFRVDDDYIVDATMCGGLARYVNHSCEPNCSAEIVNFDGSSHILILTNKKVEKGEELTYDYNFDYEDRSNKIPCLCGASSCRNWMN